MAIKLSSDTDMQSVAKVLNLPAPTAPGDAVPKGYADAIRTGKGPLATLTHASGVMNIDCDAGPFYVLPAANFTANITSITLSNLPAASFAITLLIRIQQNASAAKTMAWPSSFKWAGGSPPAISTGLSAFDVLAITSFDQGTTWYAILNKAWA